MPHYDDRGDDDEDFDRIDFAQEGSALRAATKSNPRNLPCPTCRAPNRLTPADVARGYQCDRCADATERGVDIYVEDEEGDDDPDPACTNPGGHVWAYSGTAYGGDDERWQGEGRCYCEHCGADGDA